MPKKVLTYTDWHSLNIPIDKLISIRIILLGANINLLLMTNFNIMYYCMHLHTGSMRYINAIYIIYWWISISSVSCIWFVIMSDTKWWRVTAIRNFNIIVILPPFSLDLQCQMSHVHLWSIWIVYQIWEAFSQIENSIIGAELYQIHY